MSYPCNCCCCVSLRETGNSKGFGFVTFSSGQEAQAAIDNANGMELDGRTIRVNLSKPREQGGGGGGYGAGGGGGKLHHHLFMPHDLDT